MILLISSEKGGTGKTTFATNIAAMHSRNGNEVYLLDTDPNGSASFWSQVRDENDNKYPIICTQKFGEIDKEVKKLSSKFSDIIIDAGGKDSREVRTASLIADKIYIPVQASQFDIWSLAGMERIVSRARDYNKKLEAFIIINRASTNPVVNETKDTQKLMTELEHINLSFCVIKERIAFRKAARDGLSVTELIGRDKDNKAITEIQNLYREIYNNE